MRCRRAPAVRAQKKVSMPIQPQSELSLQAVISELSCNVRMYRRVQYPVALGGGAQRRRASGGKEGEVWPWKRPRAARAPNVMAEKVKVACLSMQVAL